MKRCNQPLPSSCRPGGIGGVNFNVLKVAIIYVAVGLVIAVVGGTLIEKLHMEPYVEEFIRSAGGVDIESPTLTKRERVQFAKEQVVSTFKKVFPYILAGVGIGVSKFIVEGVTPGGVKE